MTAQETVAIAAVRSSITSAHNTAISQAAAILDEYASRGSAVAIEARKRVLQLKREA